MTVGARLYLDTSSVLRATVESGASPDIEERIREAELLITSRLSLVEGARALLRLRQLGTVQEALLAEFERSAEQIWVRCHVWGLTPSVCALAQTIAPRKNLRTLDALHLATFSLARKKIEKLELLTVDARLEAGAG